MARSRRTASNRPMLLPSPNFWSDGKYRSWTKIPVSDRTIILTLLKAKRDVDAILRQFPRVTIGTLAAVKAQFPR